MERGELKSILESILFAYSDPINPKEIKKILDVEIDVKEIKSALDEVKQEYSDSKRGIQIIIMEGKYQMVSSPDNYDHLKNLFQPKKKKTLTQASIETLSIIAYKQPVTKAEIEEVRGVKCDRAISTLLENDLIKEAGRLKKIGNPIIYKTTDEFLKIFGFESIRQLPNIESFADENEQKKEESE